MCVRVRLVGITADDLARPHTGRSGCPVDLVADMMTKATLIALCAALLACLGLAGALWWQSGTVDGLTVENARLSRSLTALSEQAEQSALAREVERARADRFAARNATLTEAVEQILIGGIPDAMLDPDLAALINGLRTED